LLPQELPFVSVARLLRWQTQHDDLLSGTTIRSLVRSHGQVIRQAEQAEVSALAARDHLAPLNLKLVPHEQRRRRAGWPAALNAAVEAALASEQVRPPADRSWADCERVLAARRAETTCPIEELRHLGPEVQPNQLLLTVDEVLTRGPEVGHFLELRTARLLTKHGYRYLSGVGAALLQRLQVAVLLCLGPLSSLNSSRICRPEQHRSRTIGSGGAIGSTLGVRMWRKQLTLSSSGGRRTEACTGASERVTHWPRCERSC
jgi:hypothetical protein